MINYISGIVFVLLLILGSPILLSALSSGNSGTVVFAILYLLIDFFIAGGIKLAAQWEKGVVFRLGKYKSVEGPGLFFIIPLVDQVNMVDMRIRTLDIPSQQAITKDNVPVHINGVIFFKVDKAQEVIIKVQDFESAISQYAQTALRDIIGQVTLDQVLSDREKIGKKIKGVVEKDTSGWGMEVAGINILDIEMPEDLKKMMSRQASAEREKRATITKAEGDREAAKNLAAAAKTMHESPGAMQLRTLQTVDGLGPTASNTVVIAVPLELMETIQELRNKLKK